MSEVMRPARPIRIKRSSSLRSIEHQVRNMAQPVNDITGLVVELAEVPKQLHSLHRHHEETRRLISGERRAYAAEHATSQAELKHLSAATIALEEKLEQQRKSCEKQTASVNRLVGAIGAIGAILAILKMLNDMHH